MAEGRIAFSDDRHRPRSISRRGRSATRAGRGRSGRSAVYLASIARTRRGGMHTRGSRTAPTSTTLMRGPRLILSRWVVLAARKRRECREREYGSASRKTVGEVLIRPLHAQWAIRLRDHVARAHLRGCSWWFGYVLGRAEAAWGPVPESARGWEIGIVYGIKHELLAGGGMAILVTSVLDVRTQLTAEAASGARGWDHTSPRESA